MHIFRIYYKNTIIDWVLNWFKKCCHFQLLLLSFEILRKLNFWHHSSVHVQTLSDGKKNISNFKKRRCGSNFTTVHTIYFTWFFICLFRCEAIDFTWYTAVTYFPLKSLAIPQNIFSSNINHQRKNSRARHYDRNSYWNGTKVCNYYLASRRNNRLYNISFVKFGNESVTVSIAMFYQGNYVRL